jgi:hypothetical protein
VIAAARASKLIAAERRRALPSPAIRSTPGQAAIREISLCVVGRKPPAERRQLSCRERSALKYATQGLPLSLIEAGHIGPTSPPAERPRKRELKRNI